MTHAGSIRVGLVGTGYAAKLRADAIQADPRSHLIAVASHQFDQAQAFSQPYGSDAMDQWTDLVCRPDIDLVIVATINRDHGAIAQAALQAGKHVVVEYPLALEVEAAEQLIALAQEQNRLLHVEHIELLGGLHQALLAHLPEIGIPFYLRYSTIKPEHPAPQKWTYRADLFGFPLMGALSRIHRLTHAFGPVERVQSQVHYWAEGQRFNSDAYTGCLCMAQLCFESGLLADVTYGKGETLWQAARFLEVHGDQGALIFDRDQGTLIQADTTRSIEVGGRRGLFMKDTQMVLDHLTSPDTPLYVTPQESLYALRVADAARRSAEKGGQPEGVGRGGQLRNS